MTGSIETSVKSWLNEHGYPLEMEAASIAKSSGFDVSQSDYYIDPDEDVPREIDLIVSANKFGRKYNLSYNLFVECKSSKKEKPWLVFSSENELSGKANSIEEHVRKMARHSSFLASEHAEKILLMTDINDGLDKLYPRLGVEPMLGYGVTQASVTDSDVPFKAMMSATKAAMSHIKRFGAPILSIPCTIAIPVIVIDSPLFCVSYNQGSDEFKIKKITRAEILWKHLVAGKSRIGVFIVERSCLADFFSDCKKASDWWLNIDENELEKITEINAKNSK